MSHSKLIEKSTGPHLGVGGTGLSRHHIGSSQSGKEPSDLQQKHLQHIVSSGRNSFQAMDDATNVRTNPLLGSNLQGPLA